MALPAERQRLQEDEERTRQWKRWGPYLSERAWGTVREDYSPDGTAWDYFPHEHARSRAYRWNEDGLAGISDRHQRICFALALWNGQDPILKERLFGLTGSEGNHGEDVKEYYFYLDSTPTHSLHALALQVSAARLSLCGSGRREPPPRTRRSREYELIDTGAFSTRTATSTCSCEYAKVDPEDLLDQDHGHQSRPGTGVAITCCRPSGSATPGPGTKRRSARRCAAKNRWLARRWSSLEEPKYGRRWLYCRRVARPALHRERDQHARGSFGHGEPGLLQGRHQRLPSSTATRTRSTRRVSAPRPSAHYCRRGAGRRDVDLQAAADATRARHACWMEPPLAPTSSRRLRDAAATKPTRSTRTSARLTLAGRRRLVMRQALRGPALVEAVLSLRRAATGSRAIRRSPRRPAERARRAATASGRISTTPTSSRCRTSGSTPGTRPGISPFTACRSRWSIPTSPRSSSC